MSTSDTSSTSLLPVDRFDIRATLGTGGFGVVYRAFDHELGAQVALKSLRQDNPRAIYRFKREFRALADIAHPNLVTLFELIQEESAWFFTMELVNGQDFLRWVSAPAGAEMAVDLPRLYRALRQLTQGISALHEYGKLHRDIKPSNVLVTAEGRVVVLDFGLVSELSGATGGLNNLEQQMSGEATHFAGTPRYMSPEQALGEALGEASDWYSVGVMLYEALSGGIAPVTGDTQLQLMLRKQSIEPRPLAELVEGVPEALVDLCMALLRINPGERFGACEILKILNRLDPESATELPAKCVDGQPPPDALWGAAPTGSHPDEQHFVGREEHLERLQRALQTSALANRPAVVHIRGASGMGKSTLVRQFIHSMATERFGYQEDAVPVVLQGRCYQNESMPFKALDSLMDALSVFLHRLDAEELGAWVGDEISALCRLFPVLERAPAIRQLLDGVQAEHTWEDLAAQDARVVREAAFRGLRSLLGGLARKHTLILYIDDIHWGDEDSAMLFKELLCPPGPPPIFLMMAWRREDAQSSPFLSTFFSLMSGLQADLKPLEVDVDELSEAESIALAQSLLAPHRPGQTRTAARVEAIAREGGGNPFFIDELARYTRKYDTGPDSDLTSLGDVIYRRVTQLPPLARRLLEVIVVAGQPVGRRVARLAAAIDQGEQTALATLRREHLIRHQTARDCEWLEPYHARVGETLARRLDESTRAKYHGAIAASMESVGHFDPESLARHFLAAGHREKGGHYSLQAARRAEDALAFEHAARLYIQALDAREWPGKRAEILARLGANHGYLGRGHRAAQAFGHAADLSSPEQARHLQIRAAEQLLRVGRYQRGMASIEAVLRQSGFKPPGSKAQMSASILWRRFQLMRRDFAVEPVPRDALPAGEYARIEAMWTAAKMSALIDPIRGAYYHYHTMHAVLDAGSAEHLTLVFCQQAAQEAAVAPNMAFVNALLAHAGEYAAASSRPDYVRSYIRFMRGFCQFMVGDFRRGYLAIREAENMLRERCTGVTWEVISFRFMAFLPALWLGDFQRFADEIPGLLEQVAGRNDSYHRVALRSWHYPGHLLADAPELAMAELEKAISEWTPKAYHIQHFWYLQGMVDTALYAGDPARARRLLEAHRGPLKRSMLLRNEIIRVSVWNLRARSALAAMREAGLGPKARRRLEREAKRLISRLRAPGRHRWAHPLADLLEAELCVIHAQPGAALALYSRAEAELLARDMRLYGLAARRRRGESLGGAAGQTLIDSADRQMCERGIQNPRALTGMLTGAAPS